ncbi:MAG TPA: SPOCS domain-containing protein [Clostridia bacterium]
MSLELIKDSIKISRTITRNMAQTIVESDLIVPDSKPDITGILVLDGDAVVTGVKVTGDRFTVDGLLNYKILYTPDDADENVKSIFSSVNFSHMLDATDGIDADAISGATIENIEYNVLNGRKINVRSVVRIDYKVVSYGDYPVAKDIKSDDEVQVLRSKIALNTCTMRTEEEFTISESLDVPSGKASVIEILRNDVSITGVECKITDNKVQVRGEVNITTLYISDDVSRGLQLMEHGIPFSQFIDLKGISEDANCDVSYRINDYSFEIAEDSDGQPRVINAEIRVGTHLEGYEKADIDLFEDAYSLRSDILLDKEEITVDDLFAESRSQIVLKDTLTLTEENNDIGEVIHVFSKPLLSGFKITEDKVLLEGSVILSALYEEGSEERKLSGQNQEVPFKHSVELKGAMPDMICEVKLEPEHCNYSVASSGEIEVKLGICANIKVIKHVKLPVIVKAVELPFDEKKWEGKGSIIVYFCKPGDSLWKVAKKYNSPIEALKTLNNIDDKERLEPGQQILILRKT